MRKRFPVLAAALAATAFLASCAASTTEDDGTGSLSGSITFWWWGEEQTPGLEQWVAETVAAFEEANPGTKIRAVHQNTDAIVPAWEAAMQSQSGPDITFFWSTGDLPRAVWNGSIAPLDDLLGEEEIDHYSPLVRNMDSFDGKLYAVPWVLEGYPVIYNRKLLAEAGIEDFPATWDAFMSACAALKAEGIVPLSFGLKDGWHIGYLMPGLFMSLVSDHVDYFKLFIGDESFTDPRYLTVWTRIQELVEEGCVNEDVASIDFYEAQNRFVAGKVAMTIGNASSGSQFEREMGDDIVGLAPYPSIGDGPMAGTYAVVDQKLAITSWSKNKEVAAAFLKFMHQPERLRAQYEAARAIPLDDRFDKSVLSPYDEENLALADKKGSGPYVQALNPPQWEYGTLYTVGPEIMLGRHSPAEGAKLIEEGMENWRQAQPDAVARYRQWMTDWE
jgi:ABC-type glycerol-3-phosphate transport system substrate-binding protein